MKINFTLNNPLKLNFTKYIVNSYIQSSFWHLINNFNRRFCFVGTSKSNYRKRQELFIFTMNVVNVVLGKSQEPKKFKPATVEKHLELYFDLGTLLAIDENELDEKKLRSSTDSYLQSLARDNSQLLINKIWELPTEKYDDVTVATLPQPLHILPRAMPVPKPKPLTKWEKFAKEKGIVKKKKDKLKWDDILKKWVPLYGYRRAEAEKEKDWVLEVPDNADPFEDQFAKKMSEKSEKTAKNEFQRLRNIAKAKNIKLPKLGFTPTNKPSPSTLGAAMVVAKSSTASLGKFQQSLPKEVKVKNVNQFLPGGSKRKLPAPKPAEEKEKNMKLIDNILNKKPKLNIDQAIEKEVHSENRKEVNSKKKNKKNSGRKTKKGAKGGKFRGPTKVSTEISGKKNVKVSKSMKQRPRKGGKIKGGRKRR